MFCRPILTKLSLLLSTHTYVNPVGGHSHIILKSSLAVLELIEKILARFSHVGRLIQTESRITGIRGRKNIRKGRGRIEKYNCGIKKQHENLLFILRTLIHERHPKIEYTQTTIRHRGVSLSSIGDFERYI